MLLSLGCGVRVVLGLLLAQGIVASEGADGFEVNLWPVVEHVRLEDGKHRTQVLFLYHRTRDPDGATYSYHVLNWIRSPRFTAVLPIFARIGRPGHVHTLVPPLWFSGPGYAVAPPLLGASWRRGDGGRSWWLTPLAHADLRADGSLERMHALLYFQGRDYHLLPPIAWAIGPAGRRHVGVLPLWVAGPRFWVAPPALAASWRRDDGGTRTWITPLFHLARDGAGRVEHLHVGPYIRGRDFMALLPLGWWSGPPGQRQGGLLPLWLQGRDWWCSPAALLAGWRGADGGRTTWITPLAHVRRDAKGALASFHALNVVHTPRLDLVFPLAWRSGPPGQRSGAVLPFLIAGRDWWVAPLALSGGTRGVDGRRVRWITPLYHDTRGREGERIRHLLTWFSGRSGGGRAVSGRMVPRTGYEIVFPLFYRWWETAEGITRAWTAFLPVVVAGPDVTAFPLALTARWRHGDGGASTWITPLFHRRVDREGALRHQHVLNWFAGVSRSGRYQVLAPLFYRLVRPGGTHLGVVPLWFSGPGYRVAPALLAGRWIHPGGSATWITPLAHVTRRADGGFASWHALNWISAGDLRLLFPIAYRSGPPTARHAGVVPLWFQGPGYRAAPPLLSWWSRRADGSDSTWITPLFHRDRDPAGRTTGMHALTWIQGREWRALLPLWYRIGHGGQRRTGVVPLWFSGPDGWVAPLALSARWRRGARTSTWITPLAHLDRDADGVRRAHLLTWFHGRGYDVVAPLAWRAHGHRGLLPLWLDGPRYAVCPPLLSASWRRADGGKSTWITPLAHRGTDAAGHVTDWHLLNVVRTGKTTLVLPLFLHDPRHLVIAPLYWRSGSGADARSALLPFYVAGPRGWMAPLLLSARWRQDERTTTVVTPLYHRTTAAGAVRHEHLLTWVRTPRMRALVPLWWKWTGTHGERRSLGVPLWYHRATADGERTTTVIPALFSYRRGRALDASLPYQLLPFIVQRTDDGAEVNIGWRLYHWRRWQGVRSVTVGPLWWSQRRPGERTRWQVLGGLFGRDVHAASGSSRCYALWVIPLGARRPGPVATPVL